MQKTAISVHYIHLSTTTDYHQFYKKVVKISK